MGMSISGIEIPISVQQTVNIYSQLAGQFQLPTKNHPLLPLLWPREKKKRRRKKVNIPKQRKNK